MRLQEFTYELPEELIAQEPAPVRDRSRMMVVHRETGECELRTFSDLPDYAREGDVVVVNDSRVFPARLIGSKPTGGLIELLLLTRRPEGPQERWEVLLRPAKRVAVGTTIGLAEGCRATLLERLSDKQWLAAFETPVPFDDFLARFGRAPLPPYIKRRRDQAPSPLDLERYQTIYARVKGSVAAPTAGLHFTESLLARLDAMGVRRAFVTLHIGLDTFRPVRADNLEDHEMHSERFSISEEAAETINSTRGRIIAVGTTSARALESAADGGRCVRATCESTRLFITPGYRFRVVEAMLTNFHLPRSTLLVMISALAGRERVLAAYQEAVAQRYRFFSFGDAMLIL